MWIPRKAEAVMQQFARQFPVVFVTGARQVGKTSTPAHLYPEYAYVTLCRVKEEFALVKQVRAINGIKTDFALRRQQKRIVLSAAPAATTQ